MLAAESAWRILRLEHVRLRQLSATILRTMQVDHWHGRDSQRKLLRSLVSGLQSFNDAAHRPKGQLLMDALRQHPDMADFLHDLAQEQARCDLLLAEAIGLLDAVDGGDRPAAERCAALLQQHHRLLLSLLEHEDTALHWRTSERLTPEDWSAVASSISAVLAGGQPQRRPSHH